MTFQPSCPLPSGPVTTQERTWQFRQLHGQPEDVYATGGWNDLQAWLKK
ncbi:hypothetical protein [Deinococcus hohokamensis]|uniref:Uncharacterized protein n=1 Tax=Deinococcus hohokamensis TaxID=309883 RepID=A0ABV9I5F7_9DEIO